MALMAWNDTYSVKVQTLDDQHKRLFQILNELHHAMETGKGKLVLSDLLNRLIGYTRSHFADEEKAMAAAKYPDLATHVAEHRELTKKVEQFSRDFQAGTAGITLQLMSFLQQWLTSHILKVDRKYSSCLTGRV